MQLQIRKIQKALSSRLLSSKWLKMVSPNDHKTTGHCYIATEALWHLQGKDRFKWQPMVASYIDNNIKCTHWWLTNKKTGKILDPTKEQYYPNKPPYHLGRNAGFLTTKPSKRTVKILEYFMACEAQSLAKRH